MEKPWETASRTQIKSWIRGAALCLQTSGNYDDWIDAVVIGVVGVPQTFQWTENDAHEFIILHEREIKAARRLLDAWLAAED